MNSDEEAAELEPVGDEPIQKRYRRYHSVEFHDKLLVSVMIVVKERFVVMVLYRYRLESNAIKVQITAILKQMLVV